MVELVPMFCPLAMPMVIRFGWIGRRIFHLTPGTGPTGPTQENGIMLIVHSWTMYSNIMI